MSGRGRLVVFDLDGTLVDSAPGIVAAIQQAFWAVDIPPPAASELQVWIGPPIRDRLAVEMAANGPEVIRTAQAAFRSYYAANGAAESVLYPGVISTLLGLRDQGRQLAIATSKPQALTVATLSHHGIDHLMHDVAAQPNEGERVPKEELLGQLRSRGAALGGALMVGDRDADIRAGWSHGMTTVGAAWGYGTPQELRAANVDVMVESLPDLLVLF